MDMMATDGRKGLTAVSDMGVWNWIFIGPDPDKLPLIAGGAGGLEEMRDCYEVFTVDDDNSNLYGLLRLEFRGEKADASETDRRTKFVFIRASRFDDNACMNVIKQGQLASLKGAMEKSMAEFCHFAIVMDILSIQDFNMPTIMDKMLRAHAQDKDFLNTDCMARGQVAHELRARKSKETGQALPGWNKQRPTIMASREAWRRSTVSVVPPDVQEGCEKVECPPAQDESDAEEEPEEPEVPQEPEVPEEEPVEEEAAPEEPVVVPTPTPEPAPAPKVEAPPKKKKVEYPVYDLGQPVNVYCPSRKRWLDDGLIIKKLTQPGMHDGMALKMGSVKVHYNEKKTYTWLLPCHFRDYLKNSDRPRPPAPGSGELFKQTHNWFSKSHVRYFDLSDGYLRWWPTLDDAKKGHTQSGEIYLVDLDIKAEGTKFWIRAKSTKGLIYAFDATTDEGCDAWVKGMRRHGAFSNAMEEYNAKAAQGATAALAA